MPRFRAVDGGDVSPKTPRTDRVRVADTAAEAMITRGLQRAFPHAVIVGEEAAETDPDYRAKLAQAELAFIIDPVDGTWNFARGLPAFGTMVAATRFGRPVFGMIYDPVGRDVVWADLDTPSAWLPRRGRARDIHTAPAKPLNELMGYMELSFLPAGQKRVAALQCLNLQHFSTLRCSAHQYRLLAQGAVDFNLATKLSPWDHMAGVLLVQQAGGHAAMLDGRPYDATCDTGFLLSASCEAVWTTLRDNFAGLLADETDSPAT